MRIVTIPNTRDQYSNIKTIVAERPARIYDIFVGTAVSWDETTEEDLANLKLWGVPHVVYTDKELEECKEAFLKKYPEHLLNIPFEHTLEDHERFTRENIEREKKLAEERKQMQLEFAKKPQEARQEITVIPADRPWDRAIGFVVYEMCSSDYIHNKWIDGVKCKHEVTFQGTISGSINKKAIETIEVTR